MVKLNLSHWHPFPYKDLDHKKFNEDVDLMWNMATEKFPDDNT